VPVGQPPVDPKTSILIRDLAASVQPRSSFYLGPVIASDTRAITGQTNGVAANRRMR
jgi:hypothetical protein